MSNIHIIQRLGEESKPLLWKTLCWEITGNHLKFEIIFNYEKHTANSILGSHFGNEVGYVWKSFANMLCGEHKLALRLHETLRVVLPFPQAIESWVIIYRDLEKLLEDI